MPAKKDIRLEDLDKMDIPLEEKLAINPDYVPLASEITEEEIQKASLVKDSLTGKNVTAIKAHPPGKRLGWCNERWRSESRGWRDWVTVFYDDPVGRELYKYIEDPPRKMEGSAARDNKVRRGDTVLCWMPIGIWNQRQQKRVVDANRGVMESNQLQSLYGPDGKHGALYGEGLQDANPNKLRPRRGFVMPETAAPEVTDGYVVRANYGPDGPQRSLIREPNTDQKE